MKQSKIKRLIPKALAREILSASGRARTELEREADRAGADTVAKMRAKGYRLVTRLDSGEGIFVREQDVVSLHVQLPRGLYRRLDAACKRREQSKRWMVAEALESYLDEA